MTTQTDNRAAICKIISDMLDNPDEHGIYPTSTAFAKLELLVQERQLQVAGFVWAEACSLLDEDGDPRTYEIPNLIATLGNVFK